MKTSELLSTPKAWAKAFSQPAKEFPLTSLPLLFGKIPESLHGTLYRNGPARLARGGDRVGHWFDGDGAILAVNFSDGKATGVYRYVRTDGYLAESQADRYLYGNYGMTAPGPIWNQWFRPVKNSANTSVLALSDKLLALWEGGKPHALDLQTLQTRGLDDLSGLSGELPYSAHPKWDAQTGEIFNFGITPGVNSKLNIYKSDRTGKIVQKQSITVDGIPLLHDFVMAGQYLVFFVPPVRVNLLPAAIGLYSFSEAMQWKPKLGTQILVFDRENLSLVSRGETEPWYQWHFANGYVDANNLAVIDFVRYPDFQTNQRLKEVASGQMQTPAKSTLWQVHLDPKTAKVKTSEELLDRDCEFPLVPPSHIGKASRFTYLSLQRQDVDTAREMYGAIARFDNQTSTLTEADLGENRYPMEPIYAPDAINSERGWILTVVFDGNTNSSEVWIFDSERLDDKPVCKLGLPSIVPMGFHGTWKAATA
ncbi:carotenoid oxygenase family protein [Planktothrix sp. FACHB-1355]|uniref:Carotenoid oxygenase family protein n=1 Tax=Aerosakkonema funiforme FACHB-1375 TaxID=2949571 RepID=A0A926ZGU3_9CYAN|nr:MULTISPECIES: carotenoid oxygenase family protein [Oscillatoriales]MBD2182345.1 carotenoid oxygenase family protein [Aerosakkonema funiforme FACHB-1375]MBD3562033.1 carotenoid oxygenase family protein [Planktothrix sp. FACHB-1355]